VVDDRQHCKIVYLYVIWNVYVYNISMYPAVLPCIGVSQVVRQSLLQLFTRKAKYPCLANLDSSISGTVPNPHKLDDKAEGPYIITQVHVNGTVTIPCTEHITEQLNI
jgi:hypothetical protein